jgi:Fe2+ or Zn2+ uptake regulation protein
MIPERPTPSRERMIAFINAHSVSTRAYPTLEQIRAHMEWSHISSVRDALRTAVDAGLLDHQATGYYFEPGKPRRINRWARGNYGRP